MNHIIKIFFITSGLLALSFTLAQVSNVVTAPILDALGYWLNFINYIPFHIVTAAIFNCIKILFAAEYALGLWFISRWVLHLYK